MVEQEEQFASYNLGITWTVFGDLRESDLDDLLETMQICGVQRGNLVSLWKRHPNRQPGNA